jgi:hypothetical protein
LCSSTEPQQDKPTDTPSTSQSSFSGEDKQLQISKEVIERLKFTVFGFDTFWVTSVENYKVDGVVFKGNVRGKDPQTSYQKLSARMKARHICFLHHIL